jgi:hypothetical protein
MSDNFDRASGMTRHTALRLKNKYVLAFLAALFAFVVYQGWKDLQPAEEKAEVKSIYIRSEYLTENAASFARLPDDNHMVVVNIGRLVQKQGIVFEASDIMPISLAGRETNLLIDMDITSEMALETIPEILSAVDTWKRKNIVLGHVFFRFNGAEPDLKIVGDLFAQVYKGLEKTYWMGIVMKRTWLDNDPSARTNLANLQKETRLFLLDGKEAVGKDEKLTDAIRALEKYNLPYMLMVDQAPADLKALGLELKDIKAFQGFLVRQ